METPSSTARRVTRSQTSAAMNNVPTSKKTEINNVCSRSRKGNSERSALVDITNDSPIVGLAMGKMGSPASVAKNIGSAKQTPKTGESLLRCQVKALLQKVDEDSELPKVASDKPQVSRFEGLLNSPLVTLAPTPANTPSIPSADPEKKVLQDVACAKEQESESNDQVIDTPQEETLDSDDSVITRALLFDSPVKSDFSDASTVSTFQGSCCDEKPDTDDDASAWSIQAIASLVGEEIGEVEECQKVIGEMEDSKEEVNSDIRNLLEIEMMADMENYKEVIEGEGYDGLIDELCEGMMRVNVENKPGLPEFVGRRTRFIFNSDDELEGEEEVRDAVSPSALRLKGLPTPKGKHLRFTEED